jgi:hypothetical protein
MEMQGKKDQSEKEKEVLKTELSLNSDMTLNDQKTENDIDLYMAKKEIDQSMEAPVIQLML